MKCCFKVWIEHFRLIRRIFLVHRLPRFAAQAAIPFVIPAREAGIPSQGHETGRYKPENPRFRLRGIEAVGNHAEWHADCRCSP